MKPLKYNFDPFTPWCNSRRTPYYWLQLDYDVESLDVFHITAEMNRARDGFIFWPVEDEVVLSEFPVGHLDFRTGSVALPDWHERLGEALGVRIESPPDPARRFGTYDAYIRSARFERNSCVDFDCLKRHDGCFVGLEATHLRKPMYSESEALRLFRFILRKRFFLPGAHQMVVQERFTRRVGAAFFLIVYNLDSTGTKLDSRGMSLLFQVDEEWLRYVRDHDEDACLARARYASFLDNYKYCFGVVSG